jgi:hypothetical protein
LHAPTLNDSQPPRSLGGGELGSTGGAEVLSHGT